MPNNVVKTPRQEDLWNRAKKLASNEGHKEDYAYIMGIYKKMGGLDKSASSLIDGLFEKEAGYVGNLLGKNISKAERNVNLNQAKVDAATDALKGVKKTKGIFKKREVPAYSDAKIKEMTHGVRKDLQGAQDQHRAEVKKTFNTRLGTGAVLAGGTGAYAYGQNKKKSLESIEPNYDQNYIADNYMYMTASELVDEMYKEAAPKVVAGAKAVYDKVFPKHPKSTLDFSTAKTRLGRFGEVATFATPRRVSKIKSELGKDLHEPEIIFSKNKEYYKKNKNFVDNLNNDMSTRTMKRDDLESAQERMKDLLDESKVFKQMDIDEAKGINTKNRRKNLKGERKKLGETIADKQFEFRRADKKVKDNLGELNRYQDNELAKSLGLYTGVAGAGKVMYDVNDYNKQKKGRGSNAGQNR